MKQHTPKTTPQKRRTLREIYNASPIIQRNVLIFLCSAATILLAVLGVLVYSLLKAIGIV